MIHRICIIFWGMIFLFACTSKSIQEESSPVIYLKPGEAQTLKMSELFDGYEVLTFKGIVCNRIGDFVKLGDRIVATSIVTEGMADIVTLCVFDSIGEFQCTLGKFGRAPGEYLYLLDEIFLSPDSNVMAMDVLGLHCYALDGTLLWHKKFERPAYKNLGYPVWMLNDSCVIYSNLPCCGETYQSDRYLVNLFAWKKEQLKASYFPRQKIGNYVVDNYRYALQDTLCYFSDIDCGVYNVSEDTIILRYRIDKGGTKGFCSCDDRNRLSDYLQIKKMSENSNYVLMVGGQGGKYFFFVHDKLKKTTSTFDTVDDDLLLLGHLAFKSQSVLRLYNNWKSGVRQNDDYMYFYFSPTRFGEMINRLKETLTEEQWLQYRQAHPDIMKIYDELDDDSNTVVIGYHFKQAQNQ